MAAAALTLFSAEHGSLLRQATGCALCPSTTPNLSAWMAMTP
ncbi:hypothetical protein ULF88_10965 [Halopseudomonas pachastrellae]|nr:hypothetical protein [Halopseudomonas pachastrellae]